jgi:hypothetical protein
MRFALPLAGPAHLRFLDRSHRWPPSADDEGGYSTLLASASKRALGAKHKHIVFLAATGAFA